MAGIWERIRPGVDDRINAHLLDASMKGYYTFLEDNTVGASKPQIVNHLNAHLETPLSGQELTDLSDIADVVAVKLAISSNAAQGYVLLHEYVTMAAETGDIGETKYRADLGI